MGDFIARQLPDHDIQLLFHRRVYERVGQFAELRYVHDYDYALRALLAGCSMAFLVGEKLLGYRLHGSNTIREKPLAAIEENMQLLLGWLPALSPVLDERRLFGLERQLKDLYRYTREEWLTAVHEHLQAREGELLPLIADRERWITERDHWIAERDQIITGQQGLLAQQQQWLADRDQWITDRDGWLAERDAVIRLHTEQLEQHARWVADRDQWITDRDGWLAERDALIRQLQQQRQELLDSRAFRLGQALLNPLRWCRQRFMEVSHA
ncbi:MAG: hypothetical protein HZT40_00825 [Candidatus Thiothrix singaporensis]|uniref:Uncharacterized protein n=1 Tax=Candidatus Thiothrix singaporensis TaxID=2799669 RepID=A0A7L6AMR1_9GAMM|nr:MAG: hypothetical protein HZT40_00825 [Candidatus Thiothrix singaporensis]